MRITSIALLAISAGLLTACGPAPGSAEWCKAAIDGKITPSEAEKEQYAMQCMSHMMKDALGGMQLPQQ